ncbi:hypothetical protein, unlikely [Trypanosoma brucei gambiense DAL972]|uniref:Uncharacterized protein n=1 Tax=Trypanosoma brucei gambiense (strain MHOM/CI/86/DAL972) TaxID=679716 RepID=C9ZVV8_TRYB9|nr:hypothetical protein, unlikely [Trypanosoma brucei gambiense DAL972]CBH13546.1 hypothetical protein, unlikely [Trypanosoma brucei gambiense DAL972]|eukprot:XP_011775823.1 hypothetical protein, unlikely [Trypanosoma brucei gambiense DAL972]
MLLLSRSVRKAAQRGIRRKKLKTKENIGITPGNIISKKQKSKKVERGKGEKNGNENRASCSRVRSRTHQRKYICCLYTVSGVRMHTIFPGSSFQRQNERK